MYKCVPFFETAVKKRKGLKESGSQASFLLFWDGYSLAALCTFLFVAIVLTIFSCHHSGDFLIFDISKARGVVAAAVAPPPPPPPLPPPARVSLAAKHIVRSRVPMHSMHS